MNRKTTGIQAQIEEQNTRREMIKQAKRREEAIIRANTKGAIESKEHVTLQTTVEAIFDRFLNLSTEDKITFVGMITTKMSDEAKSAQMVVDQINNASSIEESDSEETVLIKDA